MATKPKTPAQIAADDAKLAAATAKKTAAAAKKAAAAVKKAEAAAKKKAAADEKKAKAAAAKAEAKANIVVYSADQVELTKTQQKQLDIIVKNEFKIGEQKVAMVTIAIDSGDRLNLLKTGIQKKYGKVWKAWAELNLSISYPQVSRYMKVAKNQALLEGKTYSSLEDAVKLISFDGDEKAMEESGTSKTAKREAANTAKAAKFTPGAIMEAIDQISDLETLQQLRDYIQGRIDIMAEEVDDEDEEADDDAADEADTIADILG